jgi:hypothetical protein
MPMILISPPFTQEQYEETARQLTGGKKSRMESPSDWPVEGLLSHAAGQGESTFRVVDVWESEEALNRFAEIVVPIMREAGVEGDPEVYPALTYVSA